MLGSVEPEGAGAAASLVRMTARRAVRSLAAGGVPSRLLPSLLCAVVALVGVAPVAPATAAPAVPPGYRVVAMETLAAGVEHQTLRRDEPAQQVHVARLAPGTAGRLLPVLGHNTLAGSPAALEPTSAMCARVRCVAAVNGDFFDGAGRPVGAMVSAGELLTTSGIEHILLRVDAQGRATLRPGITWSAGLTTADGRTLSVQAVNRPRAGEGITLYSRRWGPATPADPSAAAVSVQLPAGAAASLPTGTSPVRVGAAPGGGSVPILPGHVVLVGRGAGARALGDLLGRAGTGGGAVLQVDVEGIVSAIGGSPQLLQGGRTAYPTDTADSFTQDRHPRTMVGMTPAGEVLLVTADGRGTSAGLTLIESARLMADLGAVDAMNLDGGGSTTFVTGGVVRNAPSDGRERPVASSLAVLAPADPLTALLTDVANALTALLQPAA